MTVRMSKPPRPSTTVNELNALAEAAIHERSLRHVAERDLEDMLRAVQSNTNAMMLLQQEVEAEKAKVAIARDWLKWIGTHSSCMTSRHKAWVCIDKIGKR
jgi:hypothetical protein